MTKRTFTAMLLATTLSACLTSPRPLTVAQEDSQHGASGGVYMSNGAHHYGELLALDDSSIVLLTDNRVAIGALAHVARLEFEDLEVRELGPAGRLPAAALQKGKEASRFPYGITAPAMTRLLASTGQTAPAQLETMGP
jgi:hypothetical protein